MTSGNDVCPACGFTDGGIYEAEVGRFRIWCELCSHSTERYTDLDLARLEWLGGRSARE